MFEEQLETLLQKEWSEEERILIKRLMDNVAYYKKLLPKSLKQDIFDALQMCNTLKNELQYYRTICKCKLNSDENCVDSEKCVNLEKCKCGEICKCDNTCQCE
jgi:hypothetical protein